MDGGKNAPDVSGTVLGLPAVVVVAVVAVVVVVVVVEFLPCCGGDADGEFRRNPQWDER